MKTKEQLAEEVYPYGAYQSEESKVYVNAYRGAFIEGYNASRQNIDWEEMLNEFLLEDGGILEDDLPVLNRFKDFIKSKINEK